MIKMIIRLNNVHLQIYRLIPEIRTLLYLSDGEVYVMKSKYFAVIAGAAAASVFISIVLINTFQNISNSEVQPLIEPTDIQTSYENTLSSGILSANQTGRESIDINSIGRLIGQFEIKFHGVSTVKYWIESPSDRRLNGASHSSALLSLDDHKSLVVFMENSAPISEELSGKLVFAKYARAIDLEGLNLENSIVLAERGGELEESVPFSEKEFNVAKSGASALIIYNNEEGHFWGQIRSNATYVPSILVLSLSREDGLILSELASNNFTATLIPVSDFKGSASIVGIAPLLFTAETGEYDIWFHNEGPGDAEVVFNYTFEEVR